MHRQTEPSRDIPAHWRSRCSSRLANNGFWKLLDDGRQRLLWRLRRGIKPEAQADHFLPHHGVEVAPDVADLLVQASFITGECDLQRRTEKHKSKRARPKIGQVVLEALALNHCVVYHGDDTRPGESVSQKAHVCRA